METNTKSQNSFQTNITIDDDLHQQFGAEFADHDAEQILVALHKAVQD